MDDPRRVDHISIHALCEEGDILWPLQCDLIIYFYPRPLRGGRRIVHVVAQRVEDISIHALCEEGDLGRWP